MATQHRKTAKNHSSALGQIRIIGGQWRGRKLAVVDQEGLRPTTDRIKETLFNWLQFELPEARVLDAFAGTGSLGLEALSRGASEVVFIEKAISASKQLDKNIKTLLGDIQNNSDSKPRAEVHNKDTLSHLEQIKGAFDIVFLDPPFHQGLLEQCIGILAKESLVSFGSWVYIESEQSLTFSTPKNWQLYREKKAGQVSFRLFHVQ
ncbi:16S rRNA (guanine(966)-N(2))-methyltransferase RsmD [Aliidiomarina iranensis]|uniref:Ribosomal RNA small subunit methyltransferase D n=1 Tax=Aliidiomarina iranensis TaxID=1434071 RepID=A0A432W285_9GAMM|nr:16S rRNA (guanine(966)-N(2))-methyltransferase RsmD [Aliidiomarina iranensis]RUO23350.1 16S rRNA (guanine(966)-N(2))-methyltransferase RsmD [Aliidiomarina iranensis]